MALLQPPRSERDGAINVLRGSGINDGLIFISCVTDGETHTIMATEYNSYRLLAALSVVLEAPLSKATQKAIKLG